MRGHSQRSTFWARRRLRLRIARHERTSRNYRTRRWHRHGGKGSGELRARIRGYARCVESDSGSTHSAVEVDPPFLRGKGFISRAHAAPDHIRGVARQSGIRRSDSVLASAPGIASTVVYGSRPTGETGVPQENRYRGASGGYTAKQRNRQRLGSTVLIVG